MYGEGNTLPHCTVLQQNTVYIFSCNNIFGHLWKCKFKSNIISYTCSYKTDIENFNICRFLYMKEKLEQFCFSWTFKPVTWRHCFIRQLSSGGSIHWYYRFMSELIQFVHNRFVTVWPHGQNGQALNSSINIALPSKLRICLSLWSLTQRPWQKTRCLAPSYLSIQGPLCHTQTSLCLWCRRYPHFHVALHILPPEQATSLSTWSCRRCSFLVFLSVDCQPEVGSYDYNVSSLATFEYLETIVVNWFNVVSNDMFSLMTRANMDLSYQECLWYSFCSQTLS